MRLSNSYVRALFEAAHFGNGFGSDDARLSVMRKRLGEFHALMTGHEELNRFLCTDATSSGEKTGIVEALLAKAKDKPKEYAEAQELADRFLLLLAKKNRISVLGDMLTTFDRLRLELKGGLLGQVDSSDILRPEVLEGLSEAFGKKLGKKVEFLNSVDPTLLAGLKVTVAGVTYDGSLRSQLDRLRAQFSAAEV